MDRISDSDSEGTGSIPVGTTYFLSNIIGVMYSGNYQIVLDCPYFVGYSIRNLAR